MLSGDSGQGESICTPRSVSKRLFGTSASLSKRSLFGRSGSKSERDTETSGEDSDLGPMSPLRMTDKSASSRESSPGHSFVSPLATPEKSARNVIPQVWDRLRRNASGNKSGDRFSSFDALKTSTRAARSSPNRRIFGNSPKSLPSSPSREHRRGRDSRAIGTPERELALLFGEDIIPETPRRDVRDRAEETPEETDGKDEQRLVTPLSSCVSKDTSLPARIHRRKSLCLFDNEDTSSPERTGNLLKRRANDNLECVGGKIYKMDENHASVPKARAALFPEAKSNVHGPSVTNDFTLSTKTFYKSATALAKRELSVGNTDRDITERSTKRHSLPSYGSNNAYYHRRAAKRSKSRSSMMNAGVRHGIKRPKPKPNRHISRIETHKATKKQSPETNKRNRDEKVDREMTMEDDPKLSKILVETTATCPSPPSPVADPNKRFFKTNRTLKSRNVATVTVSDRIKLKVSDGRIALNDRHSRNPSESRKRTRIEDMSFDATDLTVDEPNLDISMEKRKIVVDDILKVLENDWADDDYDTMADLRILSPTRTAPSAAATLTNCPDVTMSPASVLSTMTLSMNIRDSSIPAKTSETNDEPRTKLYPLFEKGFSSNIANENSMTNKKRSDRGLKRSWQTSAKGGGAEDQYQIDAGQKKFGARTCSECGIVYQLGDPEDENAHLNYHNNVKTLKFNGWKQERVIMTDLFTNSRIISVEPGDPKQCWKKVEQVLAVVDKDLGLADMELSSYLDKKIYFYVRDKTILGVLVAESITVAHRMIPELADLNCCSADETPAKCGINMIWTAMSHRRQRIATKLVDTLRTTYFFGYIMSLEDIAFSMPTPSGKIFAEKYTKTRNFKVYS